MILISFLSFRPQQAKYVDKVMIPQDDHPEVNFVGLIIGPRGNTLKTLEKDVSSFKNFLTIAFEKYLNSYLLDQRQDHHSG